MEKINLFVVFIEGLLSFLSPCILPILPIYLSMLSNSDVNSIKEENNNFLGSSMFRNTLFFTLGISTTFFILGSSVNALSSFFNTNKNMIMLIGGLIIIFMGLFYMGIIKSSLLNREKRFNMKSREMNPISSFLLGFTFSFGWTPCIGPILASVLIMSSSASGKYTSSLLILIYTIGFILPFIIVSLFYNKLFKTIDKIKNHMELIKKIGGIIIIISGLIMVYNGFNGINKEIKMKEKSQVENSQDVNDDNSKEEADSEKIKPIDFTLYDQYGNEHTLSDYKGKTVFLNFWATWCPPCKAEMPYIEELYKEYQKNNEDVVILGVASPNLGKEKSKEYIKDFLKEEDYTFPVVFDDEGSMIFKYGINSLPSTFIINKDGYITQYVPGAMDKETMKLIIDSSK